MARELGRLRAILAEWERGNFAAGGDVVSTDVALTYFVPGGVETSHGLEEMSEYIRRDIFAQWASYRIAAGELSELDDSHVLMEGRQLGTGKRSGIEIVDELYIVFHFSGDLIDAMFWFPDRARALEAAGLAEK